MPKSIHDRPDEDLIRQLLDSGQAAYFTPIYERYYQRVYQQCFSYVKDRSVAQDLTQDVFIRVYERLKKFNFRSSFYTWLFRLTRNYCLDFLRKDGRFQTESIEDNQQAIEDISDEVLLSFKADRLKKAMAELTVFDQEMLIFKYAYSWKIDEISEHTDLSVPAVKMRLKRAKARVVKIYEEQAQSQNEQF